MKTGGPDGLLTDSILFPSHATALQKFGKPTTCDGVFGGPSCQHCGHHRSHSFLGSPLLPFLLYFGICLLVEIFPIPVPEPLNLLVYMGGLVLLFYLVGHFWKPRGPKPPSSPDEGKKKRGSDN